MVRNLHLIVVKNLEGHKRRDQQVSIMFIIALGFIIFAGCSLNLIVDFVVQFAKGLIAGDFINKTAYIHCVDDIVDSYWAVITMIKKEGFFRNISG